MSPGNLENSSTPPACRYSFAAWSPHWAVAFEHESARWHSLLGDALLAVHHIGSTAVPGLAAKPIIDLLPVVQNLAAVDELTPQIIAAGYGAWGECGLSGRRYFTRDGGEGRRLYNIHLYAKHDPAIERHLAFRDYLISHPAFRNDYEALKRAAFAAHPSDIAAYNDAKSAWLREHEQLAVAWNRECNASAATLPPGGSSPGKPGDREGLGGTFRQ
jgi:GrpB-like predicted nucleotidyltransferase (UPF0157 family)